MEWNRVGFTVSTDLSRFDWPLVHHHLSTRAYWSLGIPLEVLQRAFRNSLAFGVFEGGAQVGWARLVTDRATFAYLADVYVLPERRGQGLSKWLMECITAHPELQGLRRWMLATRDAHGLYAQFGFRPLAAPDRFMERHDPDVYARQGRG
ncbi:Acetyltransferase (GNAT) domain protein [Calidithermus terrae]|uniref:Acetyltransferase (GNAT) domain protein n=1 Tax=Calidithermus terrae TaxID=1408545 RepID=A0A399EBS2_9DEIN|nr:GNAT family N-acetyltransferase [Calidithermus terrae]RIH81256.1 Acetyltransferase (GNAT) domain protein [Calidithermus terrae]